jgi:4a-hydroxytetrahydrobiopterin dehydratase
MRMLSAERCVACRRDSPRVTEAEIAELRREVADWQLLERDGIARIERLFHFRSFADALAFTNQVGALAEEEGHHPALLTEWGRVTVTWWTHKIRGLHRNDFIMAAKTDALPPREDTARTPTPRSRAPGEPSLGCGAIHGHCAAAGLNDGLDALVLRAPGSSRHLLSGIRAQ